MALYEFIILYKPGKENFLADFLSRLNEETSAEDSDEENDYHDQLVASIEVLSIEQSIKEPWQKTELDEIKLENYLTDNQIKSKETFNVHIISLEPNSDNKNKYKSVSVKNKTKTKTSSGLRISYSNIKTKNQSSPNSKMKSEEFYTKNTTT